MLLEEICVSVGILLLGLVAFLAVKAEKNDQNPYRNIKGKKLKSSIFLCSDPYEKTDHTKTF